MGTETTSKRDLITSGLNKRVNDRSRCSRFLTPHSLELVIISVMIDQML